MSQEESFDSFYESTRHAVLVSAFALTGDRAAAEAAVRDSYAQAWRQWRRVSTQDEPLEWVRARASRLAERRHASDPSGGPEPEALSGLSQADRRRLALEVTPAAIPDPLTQVAAAVAGASYPTASVVRRAGCRRGRRPWLAVGAVVAVAVAVAGFTRTPGRDPGPAPGPDAPAAEPTAAPSPLLPVADDLLDSQQVRRLGGPRSRPWVVVRTDANTSGDGINSVCQQRRFADPRGQAAIVRAFRAVGAPRRSAVQTVEVSRSEGQARRTYDTTVGWYAGCRVARLQVLDAYRLDRVGDRAQVLVLRIADRPATTVTVAVARTGAVVTSTVTSTVAVAPPPLRQVARTLEDAVRRLCVRSVGGRCVRTPAYHAVPPPPAGPGEERGILAVADLPPVGRIDEPWVGTRPARTGTSATPSVTGCGDAGFRGAGALRSRTRTYLIPQAALPARFGLSETYGTFRSAKGAARFLAARRADLAGCERRDPSTEVGAESRRTRAVPQLDLSQWLLTTTVSASQEVRLRVGFVRVGRSVGHLAFAPTPGADLSPDVFASLLARAGDRLRELR